MTALRFFAASYVLLFHLFPLSPGAISHPTLFQRLTAAGFTGVSCFFVLSGFILAYTHSFVPDRRRFYKARFARIYPLYLFALLLALPNFLHAILRFGPRFHLLAIPVDLLLLQNWIPSLALALNTPAWTLSCEAFFYAVFPFVVRSRWLPSQRPFLLIGLLWLLQLLPPVVVNFWLVPRHPLWQPVASAVLFTPVCRLGEFLAGIVLGRFFLARRSSPSPPRAWLLPLGLAICFAFLCLNLRLPHEVIRNGLMVGPFCVLIWALATSPSRLLASRPLQIGGEVSYGVYLLQEPLSHWIAAVLLRVPSPAPQSRLWLLLVYPFAWFTYLTIEKPCRNWILNRSLSSPAKPVPTPQPDLP